MGCRSVHHHSSGVGNMNDSDKKLWHLYTQSVKPLKHNNNNNHKYEGETYEHELQTLGYDRMGEDRLAEEGRKTEEAPKLQNNPFASLQKLLCK